MKAPVIKSLDPAVTAVAVFLYGEECLAIVEDTGQSRIEYGVVVPQCDWDILIEEYNGGVLALSDARAFVNAQFLVSEKAKKAKRFGSWTSQAWINGEVG
jgi:hypothetical protein